MVLQQSCKAGRRSLVALLGLNLNNVLAADSAPLFAVSHDAVAHTEDCTFQNEIDPYTMYNDLNGDATAKASTDCKAACCADAACQVWQWSDNPMTPPNCWTGASSDYGDSGGVCCKIKPCKRDPGNNFA